MQYLAIRRAIPLVLLASSAGVLGCGSSGPQRFDVSGRVTFRGQPVPAGTIIFEPDLAQGNDGPQGVATISGGTFNTASGEGRGTVAGPHVITILGCDGINPTETSPQGKPLFAPYITNADLPTERTQVDFDIPAK